METQNLLKALSVLLQNNNNEKKQESFSNNQNFDENFFKLPNYEQQNFANNAPPQTTQKPEIDFSVLIELLPQIFSLFQKKEENNTKKREDIPSYIERLHKID